MCVKFEELLSWLGCQSIAETSARFVGDPDFYLEVVTEMISDSGFEMLRKELTAMNTKAAFDTAHALKGIIGNCGITPMYELIIQIVEALRYGNADFCDLERVYSQLMDTREEIMMKLDKTLNS